MPHPNLRRSRPSTALSPVWYHRPSPLEPFVYRGAPAARALPTVTHKSTTVTKVMTISAMKNGLALPVHGVMLGAECKESTLSGNLWIPSEIATLLGA